MIIETAFKKINRQIQILSSRLSIPEQIAREILCSAFYDCEYDELIGSIKNQSLTGIKNSSLLMFVDADETSQTNLEVSPVHTLMDNLLRHIVPRKGGKLELALLVREIMGLPPTSLEFEDLTRGVLSADNLDFKPLDFGKEAEQNAVLLATIDINESIFIFVATRVFIPEKQLEMNKTDSDLVRDHACYEHPYPVMWASPEEWNKSSELFVTSFNDENFSQIVSFQEPAVEVNQTMADHQSWLDEIVSNGLDGDMFVPKIINGQPYLVYGFPVSTDAKTKNLRSISIPTPATLFSDILVIGEDIFSFNYPDVDSEQDNRSYRKFIKHPPILEKLKSLDELKIGDSRIFGRFEPITEDSISFAMKLQPVPQKNETAWMIEGSPIEQCICIFHKVHSGDFYLWSHNDQDQCVVVIDGETETLVHADLRLVSVNGDKSWGFHNLVTSSKVNIKDAELCLFTITREAMQAILSRNHDDLISSLRYQLVHSAAQSTPSNIDPFKNAKELPIEISEVLERQSSVCVDLFSELFRTGQFWRLFD